MNQIHEMKQFPDLFNETSLENPVDIEMGACPKCQLYLHIPIHMSKFILFWGGEWWIVLMKK